MMKEIMQDAKSLFLFGINNCKYIFDDVESHNVIYGDIYGTFNYRLRKLSSEINII